MNDEKNEDVVVEQTNDAGDALDGAPENAIAKLKERLRVCETERQEYLNGWQRTKADYVNARKAEDRDRESLFATIRIASLAEFFDLADTFEIAFSHEESWNKVDKEWRVGVESIYAKLLSIFDRQGITQFGQEKERFDPARHQAIGVIHTDEANRDDLVAEIVQKGYQYNENIIRPAKVRIWQKS